MTDAEQLKAVSPLIDEIQAILSQDEAFAASRRPRARPDANAGHPGPAVPRPRSALGELAEYCEQQALYWWSLGRMQLMAEFTRWGKAAREADGN